jgi:hypothetical protein
VLEGKLGPAVAVPAICDEEHPNELGLPTNRKPRDYAKQLSKALDKVSIAYIIYS